MNRRIKNLINNNIYWLKKIEDITVDYKYFIKKEEEISYFDLYFRIDQMIFPITQSKLNFFRSNTFLSNVDKTIEFKTFCVSDSNIIRTSVTFISKEKIIQSYYLESSFRNFPVIDRVTEREINFKIKRFYKNNGIYLWKDKREKEFCSKLLDIIQYVNAYCFDD